MRQSASPGRSAATGGRRTVLFLVLLALLFTALTTAVSDAAPAAAGICAVRAEEPERTGAADRACEAPAHVLTPSGEDPRHPGSGFRRLCHATACHLRPHAPTGPSGKAVRESGGPESLAAPGQAAPWAVLPTASAGSLTRVTVLRC
ncbi:hypothetical protein ADL22_11145 [Streptomyces sp. NRRL F-4489]|uniref:hypothetical protein n=1 Tax=Streptomyces sp. NRRL F-4489 TaxID=1609095 RepID=UPI0007466E20|nr:hypothetical protein [Streptomyces sp. NRRL F-4489]KUL46060.1 hypothetical protein ADL22_11145 [Streptomyces sp. NRRL F-4489]